MNDNQAGQGILAIWNDVAPGTEAEYEFWFQSEHLEERVSVPGFRLGRRHEAVEGTPRFFVFYRTDSPDTLTSKAYLDRVNDPTPLTTRVMSEVFRNMNRTVCRLVHHAGDLSGAFIVTARLGGTPDIAGSSDALAQFEDDPGIACREVWVSAEPEDKRQSEEEILRGGDAKIAGCIAVGTLREADARRVAAILDSGIVGPKEIGIYRFLCERRATG